MHGESWSVHKDITIYRLVSDEKFHPPDGDEQYRQLDYCSIVELYHCKSKENVKGGCVDESIERNIYQCQGNDVNKRKAGG